MDENIEEYFEIFFNELNNKGLLNNATKLQSEPKLDAELIKESDFKISFREFGENATIELIKKGE